MKVEGVRCPECGAKIPKEAVSLERTAVCEYCGTLIVLSPESLARPQSPRFQRPFPRFGRPRQPQSNLRLIPLFVEKGAIDGNELRKATRERLLAGVPRFVAARQAVRELARTGKIDRDRVFRALNELVAEKRIPPQVAQSVERLFHNGDLSNV